VTPAASAAAMAVQAMPAVIPPGTHRFNFPLKTERELRFYIACAFGIRIPDVQVCPDHSTPWRAFCDAYFARSPVQVWVASRGFGGKSFLLSLLGMVEALTLGADTNILGGSGEQSERVLEHMTTLMQRKNAPRHAIDGDVKREMRLVNGALVRSLMASTRSVRGPHPSRLLIDEADEAEIAIIDAALGQPMSTPSVTANTVLSSTHHYPDGTMTELLKRAADRGWPVHRWCYQETREVNGGWLSEAQIEATRSTVPQAMWEAEYELQEPSPESRAIMPASVKAMFRRELGVFEGQPRQYVEIEAPVGTATYSTGCDWAKERDWTIIVTLRTDCVPAKVVAFERLGREPYPAMVSRFDFQVRRFRSRASYDLTGLGTVVKDLLGVPAKGVVMAGRDRADLISNYIGAIERGKIEAPFIAHMEAEHRLASRAIYQAGDEHLPDTIAAGALAWRASSTSEAFIV
jgi:hypothetical protein